LVRAQEAVPQFGYDYRIRVLDPENDDFFVINLILTYTVVDTREV
jgi:hypothetical protein